MGPGDRELHPLVGADRPAEDHALVRVADRLLDEPLSVADRVGGDEDPLGVHAVEDIAEPLALLADQAGGGDLHVVEEEGVGGVVHHHAERPHLEPAGLPDVDEEDREPVGLPGDVGERSRAGEQQHEVRLEDARDEDLLPVHHVAVAAPDCRRLELGGVRARVRLGHREGLQPELTAGDLREVRLLLRLAPVTQERGRRRRYPPSG